jgi:glycosyltransferase involved in cell wall biosynthesis
VVGECTGDPYSKSIAVNDAARKATGDIFVILDADTWLPPPVIEQCAEAIRTSRTDVWYIPYHVVYRLVREDTAAILASDAATCEPLSVPARYEERIDKPPGGAQIIPARGFRTVGGYDPRFRGWGGQDRAFVRAADTLYVAHRRTRNAVISLWHERVGAKSKKHTSWRDGLPYGKNDVTRTLVKRYKSACGDVSQMRALVDKARER